MGRLELAAIFSDSCVLQRRRPICIFGQGEDGFKVTAVLRGITLETQSVQEARAMAVVKNGRFEILLPALEAGLEHTLVIKSGDETIERKNIAIGEVWLAGGQSNMEFELQNCEEKAVLEREKPSTMLRFYYTQKKAYIDEEFLASEKRSHWECFGDEGTRYWSAVGYFFGAKCQAKLQVPIGIIGCNWGGTSASAWMPRTSIEEEESLRVYLEAYDQAIEGKSEEQQRKEYDEYVIYQAEFDKNAEKCYRENPDIEWSEVLEKIGECRYPGPMGCSNPYRPGGLYECMLKRIMPYAMKGVIFYQGESDDHQPGLYETLFSKMITKWREDWDDDMLPFIYVQLPMHRYKQDPDFKNWPFIREAQQRVHDKMKNAYMCCMIDQGVWNDIHPKKKKTVGERMADVALCEVYKKGKEEEVFSPMYSYMEIKSEEIWLHFEYAQGGFFVLDAEKNLIKENTKEYVKKLSEGFEIAGADGVYQAADARIVKDSIVLTSDCIAAPKYARYLWTNYAQVSVFGKNGLPLAPFRTSRKDGVAVQKESAKIQQNMVVGSAKES